MVFQMNETRSFKFLDDQLNRDLLKVLKRAKIAHSVDKNGCVIYSVDDKLVVENELIRIIRLRVFPSWAIITCPENWISVYKEYMLQRDIPFTEELHDGDLWFLIEGKRRPHQWKLDDPGVCPTAL
jgi:hypothetical protein